MPYGWLQRATAERPQKPALAHGGTAVTYDELLRATRGLVALLHDWGVQPGDCVATQMASTPEYVAALCAVDGAGASLLPLDPTLRPNEVAACCLRAGARILLVDQGGPEGSPSDVPLKQPVPLLQELSRMTEGLPRVEGPKDGAVRYVLMLMSSGTTGRPKIVPRTREQVHGMRRAVNSRMTLRPDDRVLAVLPLFHAAGISKALLGSLEHGCTLYLAPYSPRTAAQTIEREGITVMHGAPFIYKSLVQTNFAHTPRFDSVRRATFGTAPMQPAVARACREKLGLLVTPEYGSTEAGSTTSGLPLKGELEPGWIGWPYDGVTVDILGREGECLPPGREGQLAVRSPGAASCYLDDPEATAATFRDGRVLTGDLGLLTAEGGIRLVGRMKDVISVAGKKVSPAEVEAALSEHPQVAEALVLPGRGDEDQEVVSAYVVATGKVTPGQLRAFCGQRLAAFKVPRQVTFVPALPRSATGKVLRRVPPAGPGCE